MRTKLAPWGNSSGLRLPKVLLRQLGVAADAEFDVQIKGGELRLRPVPMRASYRLQDLLDQISPDNIPPLEDWPAVGAEIIDDDVPPR